jgi:hypothetical protein
MDQSDLFTGSRLRFKYGTQAPLGFQGLVYHLVLLDGEYMPLEVAVVIVRVH